MKLRAFNLQLDAIIINAGVQYTQNWFEPESINLARASQLLVVFREKSLILHPDNPSHTL